MSTALKPQRGCPEKSLVKQVTSVSKTSQNFVTAQLALDTI